MIVVLLRCIVDSEMADTYAKRKGETLRRCRGLTGFVSATSFRSDAGEDLYLIEFESVENLDAWRNSKEALMVQEQGRQHFFREYTVQVCSEVRRSEFSREDHALQAEVAAGHRGS